MEIRIASARELEPLCKLYEEFFGFHAMLQPEYYRPAAESGKYPFSAITSDKADILIAVEKGSAIGFLHVCEEETPPFDCFVPHRYAKVVDLFVHPDCRNQGVGSLLLTSTEMWARSRGLDYLELNVLAENEDAVRIYERGGFNKTAYTMRRGL